MSNETKIENEIFYYGLLIKKYGIQFVDNLAIKSKPQLKIIEFDESTKKSQIKLVFSTKPKDTFLLQNEIDPSAINSKYYDLISNVDESLTDKKEKSENFQSFPVYIAILCPQAEIVLENEQIEPSEKLKIAVKEALDHNNPYYKLIEIFETYGYFFPKRIVFGYKLYRACHLIAKNDLLESCTKWIDFSDSIEYNNILKEWTSLISSDFDISYLTSINGDDILIDYLQEWISKLKNDPDTSQVINWKELYPLYKIFDKHCQTEIEFVLGIDDETKKSGIKERVLITGVVPVKASTYKYRVNFPDSINSSNYKMFGKLVSQNGELIDSASIKFRSTNIFGFSVLIENFKLTNEITNLQIIWMLVGLPSEIGFYSVNTRNIPILALNSYQFTSIKHSNIPLILKVPENLPANSVMCTNIIYPLSDYETKFTTSIRNYRDNKIELTISINEEKTSYHDDEEDKGESKYSLQWCIIPLPEDQMKKTPLLNKICQPIYSFEEINDKIDPNKIYTTSEKDTDTVLATLGSVATGAFEMFIPFYDVLCEIFDITEKAGHNKFISCRLISRMCVVSQELDKSTADIKNKYSENYGHVITRCRKFVYNISESIPFVNLITNHKVETEYDEITTELDSAVKNLGLVSCIRTSENIKHDKELLH
ncbi:5761_t:CDS:2, partial [Cetraspora pellucida]